MGMDFGVRRRGPVVGALGLVVWPAISGVFLGVVATLCGYLSGGRHALVVGAFVACGAFAANALVICLTAVATEGRVQRRARHATQDWLELARGSRSCLSPAETAIGVRVEDRGALASVAAELGTVLDAGELTNSGQRG